MSLYSHLGWTALKKDPMLVYKNEHVYLRIRIDAQNVCFCSWMKGIFTRLLVSHSAQIFDADDLVS